MEKQTLIDQATPARPGLEANVATDLIYESGETGTKVYRVTTMSKTGHTSTYVTRWTYFLVGDRHGFTTSEVFVSSESNVKIGEVTEDESEVRIQRSGTITVHFGIQIPIGDYVFRKEDFKAYPV